MVRGKTVDIDKENYDYLTEQSKKAHKHIRTLVNEILAMNIERDKFLKELAPHLKKVSLETDTVILYDNKQRKSYTVVVKDGKLVCQEDQSTDCEHTHYVWALPELTKLDIKRPPSAPKH